MSQTPLVTIGLPVYNSERYVRQSLDSLLAQSYANFTLIISDNASTDATGEICQEYARKDSRIQYSRNPLNIGNPGNFNRIFSLTTTRYLKWSTSDDFWAPTFVERAVEAMEADPTIALCYPRAWIVDADGANAQAYDDCLHLMQDDPAERFMAVVSTIRLAHQHLGMIRTAHLRQTHLLGAFVGSDIPLIAELALYGKYCELPDRLFYRRYHKTSGSWKRGDTEHQAKYYLPASKPRMGYTLWRSHLRLLAAVGTAPISLGARLMLYRRLLRRMIWDRHALASELFTKPRFGVR